MWRWLMSVCVLQLCTISLAIKFIKGRPFVPEIDSSIVEIGSIYGPIYADSLSKLDVTLLTICDSNISEVSTGALCASPFRKMELHRNRLPTLNKDMFGNCSSLKTLWLHHNNIEQFDDDALSLLTSLVQLKIEGASFPIIKPTHLGNLSHLVSLTVTNCGVKIVQPGAFKNLLNLQVLVLSHNNITNLNGLLEPLVYLERLFLDYNQLEVLPADLCRFQDLEILNIRGNDINIASYGDKWAKCLPDLAISMDEWNGRECRQIVRTVIKELKINVENANINYQLDSYYYEECDRRQNLSGVLRTDSITYTL